MGLGDRPMPTTSDAKDTPIVEFFQLVPNARPPRRADRAVGGTIPARALRYCEAITSASGFGWYVFLPMRFKVIWDGHDTQWTYGDLDEWLPLEAAQYPGFSETFDRAAPADARGFAPPFLTRSIQSGGLQIWTGCIARTAPGWSLLVRPVANLARTFGYEMLEGIIETDHWFGPLFNNVRINKTDTPIEFRDDIPFLQLQPVQKDVYRGDLLQRMRINASLADLNRDDWDSFHRTVVKPNIAQDRRPGQYAVSIRKQKADALDAS
jgi:hypothetical protein